MIICESKKCTGCMTCENSCPVGAISKKTDERGFLYPSIDASKCTECRKCVKVCPANASLEKLSFEQKVFACYVKDEASRLSCTSGGAAYAISKKIIERGGRVYGAAFDDKFKVCHVGVGSVEELEKLKGSKYVQSDMRNVYKEIANDLHSQIPVLFIGTPCQVNGLRSYIGNDNPLFYTCDLVCHGVPSPHVFETYKEYMESQYDSKINYINFRYKQPGWKEFSMKLDFENGSTYIGSVYEDFFHRAFLMDYIGRDCCAECKYTNTYRVSDLTLADFWGYKPDSQIKDDDKGISLVIVNTIRGNEIFNSVKDSIILSERTLEQAVNGNPCLSHPFKPNCNKELFWKLFLRKGFSTKLRKKYLYSYAEEKKQIKIAEKRKLRRDTFNGYIHAVKKNGLFGIFKKIVRK